MERQSTLTCDQDATQCLELDLYANAIDGTRVKEFRYCFLMQTEGNKPPDNSDRGGGIVLSTDKVRGATINLGTRTQRIVFFGAFALAILVSLALQIFG